MSLLILGGTGEGKKVARALIKLASEISPQSTAPAVIYSVAGLVRQPELDCLVISGGFSQYGHNSLDGLAHYLASNHIRAVIDCTHPYASQMSETAQQACQQHLLPYLRYNRPAWQPGADDHWLSCRDWPALLTAVAPYQRPLFTLGQQPLAYLAHIGEHQHWLIRSAVVPSRQHQQEQTFREPAAGASTTTEPAKQHYQTITAIGPFTLTQERALFKAQAIDVLISKNSGGNATSAKLDAARELGLPVLMLARPTLSTGQHTDLIQVHEQVSTLIDACKPLLR